MAWSLWHGDPEREVVLTVRTPGSGDSVLRVRYLPHGKLVTIPQAEITTGCATEWDVGGGTSTATP